MWKGDPEYKTYYVWAVLQKLSFNASSEIK